MNIDLSVRWSYLLRTGYESVWPNAGPEGREIILKSSEGEMCSDRVPNIGEKIILRHPTDKDGVLPRNYRVQDVVWDFGRCPPEPPYLILDAEGRDPENLKKLVQK